LDIKKKLKNFKFKMELHEERSMTLDLEWINKATNTKTFKFSIMSILIISALIAYPSVRKHTKQAYKHMATKKYKGRAHCEGGGYTHVLYFYVRRSPNKQTLKACYTNSPLTLEDQGFTNQDCLKQKAAVKTGYDFINYNFLAKPSHPIKIELFNYNYSKDKPERALTLTTNDHTAVSWNWPGYVPEEVESGKICWNGKCFDWKANSRDMLDDGKRCGMVQRHCLFGESKYGGHLFAIEDCNKLPKFGNPVELASRPMIIVQNVEKFKANYGKPLVA
jgi:hypothetical protein